jgi:hypothetical protein
MSKSVKVYFDNGDSLETFINGTEQEIHDYFFCQEFNIGKGEKDLMVKVIKLEFLD